MAFHTSIYGMIFSLIFNLIFKSVLEQAYHRLDEFVAEFKRYVRPDATYDNGNLELEFQKKQLEAIIATQKAIEERLLPYLRAMGENIEDIRTLTRDQNDIFREFINQFLPKYCSVLLSDDYREYVSEIIIEGHTDTNGSYIYNLELSQQRALSVAKYCLTESNGIISSDQAS